jgi:hypothetical protein
MPSRVLRGFRLAAVPLLVGAVLMVVPVLPGGRADAATPPRLEDFRLRPSSVDLQGRVDRLARVLPTLGVEDIMDQASRQARRSDGPDPCDPVPIFGERGDPPPHWCWDPADTGSIGGDEGGGRVEWMPQGITTTADAEADEQVGSKQAILVSWYDKRIDPAKGVRVSFLDPATGRYQHVLLAYPYTSAAGDPTYEILDTPQEGDHGGIHAGGIAWHGDYLYVVDTTRGVRVFDMRHIFDLEAAANGDTTDGTRIGLHDGTYRGFGYRYVMPQVDAWVNDVGADDDGDNACEAAGAPKFSYVSVDRSTTPDQLVTGEYCRSGSDDTNGRVATWPVADTGRPLADADGLWRATGAQRLPQPNIQGAVTVDGTWYLSRSRGEGPAGDNDDNGHLLEATAGVTPTGTLRTTATRWSGIGPEDLSYWPSQDAIWTVTEHPGRRAVYACPRVAPPGSAGTICGPTG